MGARGHEHPKKTFMSSLRYPVRARGESSEGESQECVLTATISHTVTVRASRVPETVRPLLPTTNP
jgi:hypothetical protein